MILVNPRGIMRYTSMSREPPDETQYSRRQNGKIWAQVPQDPSIHFMIYIPISLDLVKDRAFLDP